MFAKEFLPDIFLDALKFLDRNEIEKCQLVSNFWNSIIANKPLTLPLREFERIYFTDSSGIFAVNHWVIDLNLPNY